MKMPFSHIRGEKSEEKQNWMEDLESVIEAMYRIEGLEWKNYQLAMLHGEAEPTTESLATALKELKRVRESDPDNRIHYATVYGDGGMHRYYFYMDGSVRFSTYHATFQYSISDARALGFPLHPNDY